MTQIDFYTLADEQESARLDFACRLIETIWRKGHQLYVFVDDDAAVAHLDELLWAFRADSFVPHARLDGQVQAPVHIGCDESGGDHHDVLVNLAAQIPACFSRFERVTEIITADAQVLQNKREAWRFYRQRGYPLKHHDMRR